MSIPLALFAAVAALITAIWSWLGVPVPMPPSPLASGEKLFCMSYAPFRDGQSPLEAGTHISAAQIEQDLAQLAKVTNCVRTYSVEHGLDQVPAIAAKHGLQVIQGIWLSSQRAKNQWQLDTAIPLVNRYRETVRAVVVGNEALLRGEMSAAELKATILRVKAAVPVPVTYADVWEFWLRNAGLADAVDFITIHILPYWEDEPIAAKQAAGHVDAIRRRVAGAFPGKEILIGETGWPSAGRMRQGALPSPSNQARVLHEVLNVAKAKNYRVNIIEAYDQPWKRALEGTVGGHWGLYDDRTRAPKFAWGAALSDHPHWPVQALAGVALAALVFLSAFFAQQRLQGKAETPRWSWLGVGTLAAAAGSTLGLTLEKIPLESLGAGGWLRSIALGAVALAAPPLAAAALAGGVPTPSFARLLGGSGEPPPGKLTAALGAILILVCALATFSALGLVFDPRYKDFPYAPLTAPVIGFVILAIGSHDSAGRSARTAERVAAVVLAFGAVYISANEGFANWQAQWTAALVLALALTLVRFAGVRRRG